MCYIALRTVMPSGEAVFGGGWSNDDPSPYLSLEEAGD